MAVAFVSESQDYIAATNDNVPLIVDVDGTLIKSDYLYETIARIASKNPAVLCLCLYWLFYGKAQLKHQLARILPIAPNLPLRESVVDFIARAKGEGRQVYLASASHCRNVVPLADVLGNIDGVFASRASVNLAGAAKADVLVEAFGEGGFDYVGDSDVDFQVWSKARKVYAVSHGEGFSRRLKGTFPSAEILEADRFDHRPYLKAMRPHQWAKNTLVFLPLLAGHTFTVMADVLAALVAFVCFCLAASSAYIINDILDIDSDRRHPTKRKRPFAAGAIPIKHGVLMSIALLLITAGLSWTMLPTASVYNLGIYYSLTLAYSLALKRKAVVDVIALGSLYAIRVLGGATAIAAAESKWMLMFSLFLFLCLAICKRHTELMEREQAGAAPPAGRGYRFADRAALLVFAAVSGLLSVLVVALYMNSEQVTVLYTHPDLLWLICLVQLYWVSRVVLISNRGELDEDPVVFALRDRTSWLCGMIVFVLILMAR